MSLNTAGYTQDQVRYECSDALAFAKSMPDRSARLILTSPPYNLGKEYEVRQRLDAYLNQQAPLISELTRILADDGNLCWEVGNFVEDGEIFPLDIYFYQHFRRLGLRLRNRIIWHFGHGLHASKRFSGRYETLLWFTNERYFFDLDPVRVPSKYPGKRHYKGPRRGELSGNPAGKNPSDIWEIVLTDWEREIWDIPNVKANHPEKTSHPCQFPIELAERCILAMTEPGDTVYDPYAGVATTLIAAMKNGRRAAGADKEPQYVELGWSRIDALSRGELPMREPGTPIHTPKPTDRTAQYPEEWKSGK